MLIGFFISGQVPMSDKPNKTLLADLYLILSEYNWTLMEEGR